MAKTIRVDIVTPEKVAYTGEATMVVARTVDGEIGILPRHAPLIAPLQIWPIRLVQEEGEIIISVCGGFIEVNSDVVTILTQCAELPEEIDVERAKAAKERAEARLKGNKEGIDATRAEAALHRAIARIKAAGYTK